MSWIAKTGLALGFLAFASAGFPQARTDVHVGQLAEIEPFSIATLTLTQGRLPATQWQNSSAAIFHDLLNELPVGGGSAQINILVTRVLLSGGSLPAGSAEFADLAELRLEGAFAVGAIDAVIALAARSPGGHRDPQIAALTVNALLAANDWQAACNIANQLNEARSAAFWLRVRAFCLAQQGNRAGAELTAELAVSADPENPAFLIQINRLTTPSLEPKSVIVHSSLELAMAEAAHDLPVHSALPFSLKTALSLRQAPASTQIAFEMYAKGAIPQLGLVASLLAHTAQTPLKPALDEPALSVFEQELAALKAAKAAEGIDQIAQLFRLGQTTNHINMRAEALEALLAIELPIQQNLALHRLVIDQVRFLPLDAALAKNAALFARIALANGNVVLAQNWLQLAEPDALEAAPLDTLVLAAGGRAALSATSLAPIMGGSAAQQQQLATDLSVLIALGTKIEPALRHWLSMVQSKPTNTCPQGKQAALRLSAQQHAVAETILRAADLLRDGGFATLPEPCAAEIIAGLRTLGLEREARLAAIEWMLAIRAQP
ncbi:MAG: hypothetical protein JKX99_03685 [Robiginitomaculum sp.]|nr:hypothetical protein [Robiginitomaculum sp.]